MQITERALKIVWFKHHFGPSLKYVMTQGWVDRPENGSFTLLYAMKMSLIRRAGPSEGLIVWGASSDVGA